MTQTQKTPRFVLGAALVAALVTGPIARADAAGITIFAAASLKTALDEIAADWQTRTGDSVAISYAGSPQLARQIEAGAPADIFISAAAEWMDVLEAGGLIRPGSRVDLLGNRLVLIGQLGAPPVDLVPGVDLAGRLGEERLAMALVDAVPAGVYGKAALTSLGIWEAVAPKVAQTDNVHAALKLVAMGEAAMGIVYASDAVAEPSVAVLGRFAETTHPPIVYPAALIASGTGPEAALFLETLQGDAASAVFSGQGFIVPADPGG